MYHDYLMGKGLFRNVGKSFQKMLGKLNIYMLKDEVGWTPSIISNNLSQKDQRPKYELKLLNS